MYYVYILRSIKDGSHYTGFTDDITRRPEEHNKGKNYSTKNKSPWILIHVEIVDSRIQARKLEKFFISGFGREIISEIESTLNITIPL